MKRKPTQTLSSTIHTQKEKKGIKKKTKAEKKKEKLKEKEKDYVLHIKRKGRYALEESMMNQVRGAEDEVHFWVIKYLFQTKYKKYWKRGLMRGSIDDIHLGQLWTQHRRIKLLGQRNGWYDSEFDLPVGKYTRLCMEFKNPCDYTVSEEQATVLKNHQKYGRAYCAIVMDKQSAEKLMEIYLDESRHDELEIEYNKNKFPCPVWEDNSGKITRFITPTHKKKLREAEKRDISKPVNRSSKPDKKPTKPDKTIKLKKKKKVENHSSTITQYLGESSKRSTNKDLLKEQPKKLVLKKRRDVLEID